MWRYHSCLPHQHVQVPQPFTPPTCACTTAVHPTNMRRYHSCLPPPTCAGTTAVHPTNMRRYHSRSPHQHAEIIDLIRTILFPQQYGHFNGLDSPSQNMFKSSHPIYTMHTVLRQEEYMLVHSSMNITLWYKIWCVQYKRTCSIYYI